MMRKNLGNSIGNNLNAAKFPKSSNFICTACATGKLILRPPTSQNSSGATKVS
jgi:hypothetical protein